MIFASAAAAGLQVVGASGEVTPLRDPDAGTAWLTHYRPDGSVALASTIAGTAGGNPDEIGRTGNRIYLDVKVRGAGNVAAGAPVDGVGKDGSVWALDIVRVG